MSTFSKAIRSAEYGYNRDHEQLKQVNFGLVCNEEINLPIYLVHYDGSSNDQANLISVLQQLKERSLPAKVTFVLDHGFASTKNLEFMLKEKISFVMRQLYLMMHTARRWSCAVVLPYSARITDWTAKLPWTKDCVEKAFAGYKNDILDERIRTKSVEGTNGKLFLAFMALIIRRALDDKLRQYLK